MTCTLGMTVDLSMPYIMLMLVLMTVTLMQGHSGSAKANSQRSMLSTTEQAITIKLATTVGLFPPFYMTLTSQRFIWLYHPVLVFLLLACMYVVGVFAFFDILFCFGRCHQGVSVHSVRSERPSQYMGFTTANGVFTVLTAY